MPINKVGSKGIADGSVASADFADCTVSSDKLTDGTVANAKLVNSSVTLVGQSISLGASVDINLTDWQSVVTADGSTTTTAVSGQGYFIDTTSASHTINLPVSASRGDFVAIKDYAGTFGTNNLTIGRNGHNIQGVANDSLISTNRASVVLVYVDSTKGWLYWEEHNVNYFGPTFISATGGTITTSGDYKIHTFTGDGCFAVSSLGGGATPCAEATTVSYLVVAGGGSAPSDNAGGGGAGGFREGKASSDCYSASPLVAPTGLTITATTYPITVGGGGSPGGAPSHPLAPGDALGTPGSNSVFSTITSTGGGKGGHDNGPGAGPGYESEPGGSGGGAGGRATTFFGNGNTPPTSPPQGNNGGQGGSSIPNPGAGGGGGASAAGSNQSVAFNGASGGAGATTSITASPTTYAGGGGGGAGQPTGSGGSGGPGGGGAGGNSPSPGTPQGVAGTTNTGGGGGGAGQDGVSGAGGKGIVIIRYKFQ